MQNRRLLCSESCNVKLYSLYTCAILGAMRPSSGIECQFECIHCQYLYRKCHSLLKRFSECANAAIQHVIKSGLVEHDYETMKTMHGIFTVSGKHSVPLRS